MKNIGAKKKIEGRSFILEEHLEDYISAQVAGIEYRGEGWCCRVECRDEEKLYYIWVGPKRKREVRTLPGEKIKRRKGHLPKVRRVA